MKKNYLWNAACVAALTLAAAGCSNDELTEGRPDDNTPMGITEIIASTPGEGPSTRVTYEEGTASEGLTVKWSVSGDEFLYTNESEGKWYGNNASRTTAVEVPQAVRSPFRRR